MPPPGCGSDRAGLVELVAEDADRRDAAKSLPFRLGRKARSGPAGEGVGLEIADVRDRRGAVDARGVRRA